MNNGRKLKIFVSSTWQDLQSERFEVKDSISRMGYSFVGMEFFGSDPNSAIDVSLNNVEKSNIFVLILGHTYGSIVKGTSYSFVEAEYRKAITLEIPCLIYIKDDDTPVLPMFVEQDSKKIECLQNLKNELITNHVVSNFSTPKDLAKIVTTDLHKYILDNYIQESEYRDIQIALSNIIPVGMIELVLEGLSQRLQLPIGIYTADQNDSLYFYPKNQDHFSPFCRKLREHPIGEEFIRFTDINIAKQSIRLGETMVYQSHVGLTDLAVPISIGEKAIGVIFAGQMRVDNQRSDELQRIIETENQFGIKKGDLLEAYKHEPVKSREDLEILITQVEEVASYFSRLAREKSIYKTEYSIFTSNKPIKDRNFTCESFSSRQILECIRNLSEEEIAISLIIPYLEVVGFENVRYRKRGDHNFDLYCEFSDPIGSKLYYGIKIKSNWQKISCNSFDQLISILEPIQIESDYYFLDENTAEKRFLDKYLFVSPYEISKPDLNNFVDGKHHIKYQKIQLLVGHDLVESLKQHIPLLLDGLIWRIEQKL